MKDVNDAIEAVNALSCNDMDVDQHHRRPSYMPTKGLAAVLNQGLATLGEKLGKLFSFLKNMYCSLKMTIFAIFGNFAKNVTIQSALKFSN